MEDLSAARRFVTDDEKGDARNENSALGQSDLCPSVHADRRVDVMADGPADRRISEDVLSGVHGDVPFGDGDVLSSDGAVGSGDAGRNFAGSGGFPAAVGGAGTVADDADGGQRAGGFGNAGTSAANGGTVSKPNAINEQNQNAKANAKRGKIKMPKQMPSKMPELSLVTDGIELEGILQLAGEVSKTASEMASDEARGTLWRIEQNGDGNYHWRLRFSRKRITDKIRENDNVAEALATRKGRGRHADSRAEAERFRSEVEHIENLFAASGKRRRKSPSRKRKRQSGHRAAKRTGVPKMPRVSRGDVSVSGSQFVM